ncbi:MAG: hypothetical protein ABWY93_22640 [Mycobacterium sp.]
MTLRSAKTVGQIGIGAAAIAMLICILEVAGVALPGQQAPVVAMLIALAVMLLGWSWLSMTYHESQARSISAVNTAFSAGVDFGKFQRKRAPNTEARSIDDAA